MIGQIYKNSKHSGYAPAKAVRDLLARIQEDYRVGDEILNKSWTELNERSIIDDLNRGQKIANAFVNESYDDPADGWKYRGTRSAARNKGVAMAAQLTASFIIPGFSAQNDDDEVDREFSDGMNEIVRWMVQPQNSEYMSSFISLVFGMLESPVTYLGAEWYEVFQDIRVKTKEGYATKRIIDEVFSGFKAPVYSATEVRITNAYIRNIQKQRAITKERWIEYSEAQAKYGNHPDFMFVSPGQDSVFGSESGLFYDIVDNDHPTQVREVTWMCRREDREVCVLGGIYMGNENVDNNRMKHRDNRDAPKYDVVPFGFNRIGTHFFYYKSMMNAMAWDNMLYDAMSEVLMNRAFLEVDQPIAFSGTDKIDSDVVFPNSVITFSNENARAMPLLPPSNMAAGFQALIATKESIDEASLSPTMTGQLPEATQKAYTVAQAQANAKKLIQGVARSLAESIVQYGPLMADIAINHLTIPQIDEIVGEGTRVKYRKFLLEKQVVDGKEVDKEIRFDEALVGKMMTKEEKDSYSLKLLEESGYPDTKKSIRTLNPHKFSKFRYLAKIDPEEMFPMNNEAMQPILTNLYTMLQNDPYTELQALHKELMWSYFRGKGEKFTSKKPQLPTGEQDAPKKDQLGSMVQAKRLAGVASGVSM